MFLWLLSILVAFILYKWLYKPHPNFPPGPLGFPILGVIPYMSKNSPKDVFNWSKTYGPVVAVKLPSKTIVFLNTYETIHEAFSKRPSKLSGRPFLKLFHEVTKDNSGIISKDYGQNWKVHRRLANKAFRGFLFGDKGFQTIVQKEAKCAVENLKGKVNKPLNFSLEMSQITANVISQVVIGRRFEEDNLQFMKLVKAAERVMGDPADAKYLQVPMLAPFLFHVPPFKGACQRFIQVHRDIIGLMKEFVDERKKNFHPENIQCFVDAYCYEQQHANSKDAALFTDKELHSLVKDLYFAGVETSSHTLSWIFLILLHHPTCTTKLLSEIETVVGKEEPSLAHRERMPYTCAFLHEVLRYRTIAPTGAPHMANSNAEVNGCFLPKGTTILANIWAVHNDPQNWKEPDKFNPYRHIDSNGEFVASPKVMSFSLGPRRCLGELLAKSELFILLVSLLQHFNFAPDPALTELPELENGVMGGVFVPYEYKLVLYER